MVTAKQKETNRKRSRKRRFDLRFCGGLGILPEEWEELKQKVNHSCVCCGRQEPDIKLCIDHIEPLSVGGINEINNVQPLCRACNTKKGNKTINFISDWHIEHKRRVDESQLVVH